MNGLISTLPVSPPPVVASVASNSGSVAGVRAPRVTPLTGPVVVSGAPRESAGVNEPVSASPPLWDGAVAVAGVSVTVPTNAPAGMPLPVTGRPSSVMTAELSVMVETPEAAVAPASVRGPGTGLPPPRRQVPAGFDGTVWATQFAGRSRKALSPGPGYSSLP